MAIARQPNARTPEERELEDKKRVLGVLLEELANRELERATLEAELLGFQRIYLETVGQLIAQLDELEAQIAEAQAIRAPQHHTPSQDAARARKKAAESARAYSEETRASLPAGPFAPTPDLSKLFREVAKRIHPDLATSDEDRSVREELMKRANDAYHRGDVEALRSILQEYAAHPESVEGTGIGADLIRIIRKIDLVHKRLGQLQDDIARLIASDLSQLSRKVKEAELEHRDILAEMASYLRAKIHRAEIDLRELHATAAR